MPPFTIGGLPGHAAPMGRGMGGIGCGIPAAPPQIGFGTGARGHIGDTTGPRAGSVPLGSMVGGAHGKSGDRGTGLKDLGGCIGAWKRPEPPGGKRPEPPFGKRLEPPFGMPEPYVVGTGLRGLCIVWTGGWKLPDSLAGRAAGADTVCMEPRGVRMGDGGGNTSLPMTVGDGGAMRVTVGNCTGAELVAATGGIVTGGMVTGGIACG